MARIVRLPAPFVHDTLSTARPSDWPWCAFTRTSGPLLPGNRPSAERICRIDDFRQSPPGGPTQRHAGKVTYVENVGLPPQTPGVMVLFAGGSVAGLITPGGNSTAPHAVRL